VGFFFLKTEGEKEERREEFFFERKTIERWETRQKRKKENRGEEKNCNLSLWSLSPPFETTLPPPTLLLEPPLGRRSREARWLKKEKK
jgi:hypothetical protein